MIKNRTTYSKYVRSKAMKIICDFYKEKPYGNKISSIYLYRQGISKRIDAIHLLHVLQSLGYVQLSRFANEHDYYISLTDNGRCYFETCSDEVSTFWKRSIITPILVTLATNALIVGIKWLLPLILSQVSQSP
jgi:hypothetical protein